jgi:predicted O-linked N-acetylglucosamine transferase (SPINDLY family)
MTVPTWIAQAQSGNMSLDDLIQAANQLHGQGMYTQAQALYKQWIECTSSPHKFAALFNWGVMLAEQGESEEAETAYRECLKLNPHLAQAKINLGLTLERRKQFDEAMTLWRSVADPSEGTPHVSTDLKIIAHNHLGRLLETQKQFDAAEQTLVQSLSLVPDQPDVLQHYVHLRQKQCKWPVLQELPSISTNQLLAATSPLAMLALTDDPAMQWLSAMSFLQRKYQFNSANLAKDKPPHTGKIRLAYLSGDLCTHAVGLLMADLIEAHDKEKFEIYAFDFSPEDGTAYRTRLKQAFDHVIDIRHMSDLQAAQQIRQHNIDVLIDLHGLSSGARPGILALHPAPHQGTYLGFIGTTAMPWLDFVVTDRFALPAALTPYFSEKPLYIEGAMIPLHHEPVQSSHVQRKDLGLSDDAVVLACFNNIYKITPDMFACWMRILQKTSNSVLWLLDDNPWATNNLKQQAGQHGLEKRLVFAQRCTHAEYRQRLQIADIYLDTYPYNAGSTARDVLDAQLPMVTCSGKTYISRMAGSMLHTAGVPELATHNLEAYEQQVITLCHDAEKRTTIRNQLSHASVEWQTAPLKLIQSLEKQLIHMVSSQT